MTDEASTGGFEIQRAIVSHR